MYRICITIIFLLLAASSTQAGRRKDMSKTYQPAYQEPDALLPTRQPHGALQRQLQPDFHRKRSHTMGKRGIDVSHYQNQINWKLVAANRDVTYVYIKATENATLVDNMFRTNLHEARKAGIPAGIYHFFSPTASPMAQLKNLTTVVPNLKDQDLLPMIDVEVKGKASPEDLRNRLRQFLKGVEDFYGVRPILYTGQNFYNKYLAGYFEDYLFMIAKYSEGAPQLEGNAKFALWQFSASGRIDGIRGAVDCSCFMDNYSLRDILIKKK